MCARACFCLLVPVLTSHLEADDDDDDDDECRKSTKQPNIRSSENMRAHRAFGSKYAYTTPVTTAWLRRHMMEL
jgi:hypothetical protein